MTPEADGSPVVILIPYCLGKAGVSHDLTWVFHQVLDDAPLDDGIRNILVLGVLAWPVRYIIFAIGQPSWLVIASLSLHGFCFVFFFAAAFIYVDTVAPRDIRHSAQSLIMLVTYGIGSYIGSLFAGWIRDLFTADAVTNWTYVFIVPCFLTVLCAVAFLLFVKDNRPVRT